ncbi:uncharacterized protein isoform X1 [Rhodnius prolixus]|uniref:uncharacterized protein isoform X1 n=1 Tax=Rhodnius prolixus TaxID=13249 RepID=UPI003D18AE2D
MTISHTCLLETWKTGNHKLGDKLLDKCQLSGMFSQFTSNRCYTSSNRSFWRVLGKQPSILFKLEISFDSRYFFLILLAILQQDLLVQVLYLVKSYELEVLRRI